MSIDLSQLRLYVVRPTLRFLAESNLLPYSTDAENLVLGTIMVESAGKYIKQVGRGPALGLVQMEPATHDDIWNNWLLHPARKPLADRVRALETSAHITAGALELVGNLYYGVAMVRVHYRRVRENIPKDSWDEDMARYWKQHYNTMRGAGTVAKALPFFKKVCEWDFSRD